MESINLKIECFTYEKAKDMYDYLVYALKKVEQYKNADIVISKPNEEVGDRDIRIWINSHLSKSLSLISDLIRGYDVI